MKVQTGTHAVLKDIRGLQVVVVHPQDDDGEELTAQLARIGCHCQRFWPELDVLPVGTDLVLLAVRSETLALAYPWLGKPSTPPVVPVVSSESPITLAAVLQLDAFSIVASPVRSAGLLAAIVVALNQSRARRQRERYIERLEQKQAHHRVIQQATQIVMESRGIGEAEAYQLLRSQSMTRRESIEDVANHIVKASQALRF